MGDSEAHKRGGHMSDTKHTQDFMKANDHNEKGADFLDWVADRLVNVYGENPNVDFVIELRKRASMSRAAPELLKALEHVLETCIFTGNDGEEAVLKAREAIAEAIGGSDHE